MSHSLPKALLAVSALIVCALALLTPDSARAAETIHHRMEVLVKPDSHSLEVTDTITLPEEMTSAKKQKLHFMLHEGLKPASLTPGFKLKLEKRDPKASDFPHSSNPVTDAGRLKPELYRVTVPKGEKTFSLKFGGIIHHSLAVEGEEYSRDFAETPGIISEEGVYLSGATVWYPWFGTDVETMEMEVHLPSSWDAVSQGERTEHEQGAEGTRVTWKSTQPQTEAYLIAAQFTEYGRKLAGVDAMAFLRTPDEGMASRYLEATGRYLEMYNRLLGAYPYGKFALVENFWETGYGMPSFTLLGSKIIRFPFIITSSYPHEILHNWWGNGVYVDYSHGNWCEGLTAYLSDFLFKEQQGGGHEYRQHTLQKYTDYASSGRDFPLSDFRERRSSATEAVGYGKSLMFWHMLRESMGDEAFVKGLRAFYKGHLFKSAGFGDLKAAFEQSSGRNLDATFQQWVERAGAPALVVRQAEVTTEGDAYVLSLDLEQIQEGPAFRLEVPVAVTLVGSDTADQRKITMEDKKIHAAFRFSSRPLRLDVDPEYDIFRTLDLNESPPSLSGLFGAEKVLFVLPSQASPELLEAYRKLVDFWKKGRDTEIEVKLDNAVRALPDDRSVWIMGWENQLRSQAVDAFKGYDIDVSDSGVRVEKSEIPASGHSVVMVARNPAHEEYNVGWLATDSVAALPGLGRKLPHYHKYSFLGFEGDEPTNMAKGRWPVLKSPMTVFLEDAEGNPSDAAMGKLEPRLPLIDLPPVFSEKKMMAMVETLASEAYKGRGFGSEEADKAASYIADRFREAGLKPGGVEGSYFQTWKARGGDPEEEAVLKNVIGIIPGSKPEWAGQSVVIGAHYDHLGLGWPDVRKGFEGQIHPGADDNASGIAVLLELARALGPDWRPPRTVVFVAFAGEEAGRLGSKQFVAQASEYPVDKMMGMVNMDTVGRLGKNKLTILGTGSASEWIHIFFGVGYVTGVKVESVAKDFGSSDQASFIEAGVPAVQLFSGPNADYHRPSDTADKIDGEGLVKVASVAKETIDYLAGREEPLTNQLSGAGHGAPSHGGQGASASHGRHGASGGHGGSGRKVLLGTVPDFAFEGPGVRLTGTVAGSPAEKAGLKEGDVVIQMGDDKIENLRDLSIALKKLKAGDTISIGYMRDGKKEEVSTKVEAR